LRKRLSWQFPLDSSAITRWLVVLLGATFNPTMAWNYASTGWLRRTTNKQLVLADP
jgi:hypothetical protein